MVNWEMVAIDLVPRTRQQCKSYFMQLKNTGRLEQFLPRDPGDEQRRMDYLISKCI